LSGQISSWFEGPCPDRVDTYLKHAFCKYPVMPSAAEAISRRDFAGSLDIARNTHGPSFISVLADQNRVSVDL
jgi:hypothetical protein